MTNKQTWKLLGIVAGGSLIIGEGFIILLLNLTGNM